MRILEARVPTGDVGAMREFYARTLGLPRGPVPDDAAEGAFAIRAGHSTLVFEPATAAAPRETAGPCHFALDVPENQIREARDWIAQRAPIVADESGDIAHFDSWDAHAVYFRDPDGHIVELIARHRLDNASTTAFGPTSLLRVSEIGIPVPDVLDAVRMLEKTLHERPWRPAGERFAPVGDEEGLIILVQTGRFWFPTDDRAAARPSAIRLAAAQAYAGAPPELGVALHAVRRGDV